MYTGGDGYTAFAAGTDVLQPGDDLLQVTIDYITAHSPVGPVVEGRDRAGLDAPHVEHSGGPAGAPALRRSQRYAGGGEQSTVMLRSQPLPPSVHVTRPITWSPRRTRYERAVAGCTA